MVPGTCGRRVTRSELRGSASSFSFPGLVQLLDTAPEPIELTEPDFLTYMTSGGANVLGPNLGPLPDLNEDGSSEVSTAWPRCSHTVTYCGSLRVF
jgi:hypothetical protein